MLTELVHLFSSKHIFAKMVQISRGSRQFSSIRFSISQILLTIVLCAVSYYSGTISCENSVIDLKNVAKGNDNVALNDSEIEALALKKRVREGKKKEKPNIHVWGYLDP